MQTAAQTTYPTNRLSHPFSQPSTSKSVQSYFYPDLDQLAEELSVK